MWMKGDIFIVIVL